MPALERARIPRLAGFLAVGLIASVSLCAVLYLLLATAHAPVAPPAGSQLSVKDWIGGYNSYAAAYSSWQGTYALRAEAYGLSFIAALVFAVGIGIVMAPRFALLASFSLVNVYFAWTSHLLGFVSQPLGVALGQAIGWQAGIFWASGKLAYLLPQFITVGPEFVVADLQALTLLGALTASTFLLSRDRGGKTAGLISLRVAALSLTVLGVEIALFDYGELYLHVTQSQSLLGFAPSFTNADLLLSAVAVLAVSTWIPRLRSPRR